MFDTVWPVADGARHCAPLSRWHQLCDRQNGGMRGKKRWINMETSGREAGRLLNGDIPAVASWSRPPHTFYPARKLSDATSFAGRPTFFLLEYATTKLRSWTMQSSSVEPTHRFFSTPERGSRMALGVWNTFCFCSLGLFVNLLMGLDFPWQIAV